MVEQEAIPNSRGTQRGSTLSGSGATLQKVESQ